MWGKTSHYPWVKARDDGSERSELAGANATLCWSMSSSWISRGRCFQSGLLPISNGCLSWKHSSGRWEALRDPNIPSDSWAMADMAHYEKSRVRCCHLSGVPKVSSGVSWWLKRALQGRAALINNAFPLSCRNSGGRGTIRSAVNSLHSKSNRFVN